MAQLQSSTSYLSANHFIEILPRLQNLQIAKASVLDCCKIIVSHFNGKPCNAIMQKISNLQVNSP